MKRIIDDTHFFEISPSHSIPHASHEYWEEKVAEARAKMKEMGVQHLLEKKIEKRPPVLRRRIT